MKDDTKERIRTEIEEARAELENIQIDLKKYRNMIVHQQSFKEKPMSTIALSILIGIIVGGTGAGITVHKIHKSKQPTEQPTEQVAEKQVEVQLQLTDLDLLKIPCSDEYIEKHSDLLCREMFCLMQTRGIDSQTSGSDCSAISNLSNTIEILEQCEDSEGLEKEDCYRLFRERK